MKSLLRELGKATQEVLRQVLPPMIHKEDICDAIGYRENAGAPSAVVPNFIGERLFDTTNERFYVAYGVAAGEWSPVAAASYPFVGIIAAPQTATDTASLSDAQMLGGLLVGTPTAAAAYTVRTGAQLEDAILALRGNLAVGDAFDLTIINVGATTLDITLTAAAGITIVGNAVVRPGADSATEQAGQGTFRFRYTAADTFIAYRIS